MSVDTSGGMSPSVSGPIACVLVVVNKDDTEELLCAAADLAARHGARLDVLTCVEPPKDLEAIARAAELSEPSLVELLTENQRQRVTRQVACTLPHTAVQIHLALGKPFIEIIRHVRRFEIDIVVKTVEPLSGLQGLFFASTDQHLIRKCPCPIWLRLPETPSKPSTVLAAVDVDEWDASEPETLASLNQQVIDLSLRLTTGSDATVHILHAWEAIGEGLIWVHSSSPNPRLAADEYVNEVLTTRHRSLETLVHPFLGSIGEQGPRLLQSLVRGPAHTVIAQEAKRLSADIIVMGTVARTGLSGIIIGNTAEDILNSVECSIVAVKPEGFTSPINVD
ncbi:MAG: universal stress protein [Pseudomonadota bacterium]